MHIFVQAAKPSKFQQNPGKPMSKEDRYQAISDNLAKARKAPRAPKPKKEDIPYKRIEFLKQFINAHHITNANIANMLGVTSPCVSKWFAVDDVNFASAKTIIESAGYRLEVLITREEEEIANRMLRPKVPDTIFVGQNQVTNLNFLQYAIKRYGYSATSLSKASGIAQASIYYYFTCDDITFSRIYQLAQAMDCSVVISIQQIPDKEKSSILAGRERKIVVEMEDRDVYPLSASQNIL